jgi:hypothetical protein
MNDGSPYAPAEPYAAKARHCRAGLADRDVDACAGTTVFVPAGLPHTYWVTEPSRYLIVLTPGLDRLIARLQSLSDRSEIPSTLAEFDTVIVEQGSPH